VGFSVLSAGNCDGRDFRSFGNFGSLKTQMTGLTDRVEQRQKREKEKAYSFVTLFQSWNQNIGIFFQLRIEAEKDRFIILVCTECCVMEDMTNDRSRPKRMRLLWNLRGCLPDDYYQACPDKIRSPQVSDRNCSTKDILWLKISV